MKRTANKIASGLQDAVAYARIDAYWRRSKKKHEEEITQYDWGFRDGLFAARALFGGTMPKDRMDNEAAAEIVKSTPRIEGSITKRFAPPEGKTIDDLHKEWRKDPEYRTAIKKSKPITKRKPKKK